MTAQIKDLFILNGTEYSIVGQTKEIPFDLGYFNINPKMATTACMRGFQRFFTVANNKLYILNLEVNVENPENSEMEEIHNVKPIITSREENGYFNAVYKDIYHHIPYTGSLIIGEGYIHKPGSYGRIPSFWYYEKVIHLTFNDGALESNSDISSIMKKIRDTEESDYDENIIAIIDSLEKQYRSI